MTFEQFKIAYQAAFDRMMSYTLNQAGSAHYCEQLAGLADAHPEYLARFEAEIETAHYGAGAAR